jgi:hypothetical protein
MNWKRIAIFVVLMFAATFLAAFPVGVVEGFYRARGSAPPHWLIHALAVGTFAANVTVLILLAKRQKAKTWWNAWAVIFVTWVLGYPLNVGFFGQSFVGWASTILPLCVAVAIAVPIGRRLQSVA